MQLREVGRLPDRLPADDDHPYRTGAWRPTFVEYDAEDLDVVEGAIPVELAGVYLRNTENPVMGSIGRYHPFDGDGMVHAIRFANGRASYRNRFVRTAGLAAELEAGVPYAVAFQSSAVTYNAIDAYIEIFEGRHAPLPGYECRKWLDPAYMDPTIGPMTLEAFALGDVDGYWQLIQPPTTSVGFRFVRTPDRLCWLTPNPVKSLFLCECLTREHRVQVVHAAAA